MLIIMNAPNQAPCLAKSQAARFQFTICCLVGFGLSLFIPPTIRAADSGEIVAVASKASPEYVRNKLPDGTFQAENYTFGEGGRWNSPA